MKKKSFQVRFVNNIKRIIRYIKHINTKWCYDGCKCTNKRKCCDKCNMPNDEYITSEELDKIDIKLTIR